MTWSERMPTWSAKRTSPPSALTFTRIAGHVSSFAIRSPPDRLLLGRIEHLMLGDPAPTRLSHERRTPAASHFAHQLSTALSET
ncbi:hypothetical protein [Streptomyces sp. NPDC059010]|uniref:hypothetical protein n=1 Tax=Streptomyces sp. NPDC059010 TaxID=3346695 RepID=UPI0036C5B95C